MRASSYEGWLKWREEYFKNNLKINGIEVKMADQEKFIKCTCHGEGMLVTKFDDGEEVYISFWQEGINPVKLTWRMRLKLCYLALFKGNYYDDQLVLNKEGVRQFCSWVQDRYDEK